MAFGIHSKNLAADFYGQFIPEKPGVQPLGRCGQVHVGYSSLKQSNGFILLFFHCFGSFGFSSESLNDFPIQMGAFLDRLPALEYVRSKDQASLLITVSAIRFGEQLEDLHKVFELSHTASLLFSGDCRRKLCFSFNRKLSIRFGLGGYNFILSNTPGFNTFSGIVPWFKNRMTLLALKLAILIRPSSDKPAT